MSPSGATSFSEELDPKAWRIIAVVILAPFMTQLDSTVANVSLSSIQRDLHSSISSAQWIISGYLLALVLMLPLNGWLLDRVGAKKLYIFCFSAFTLASLLCGLSRTMPGLIGARIMQGVAGGLLAPLTQLMMARVAGKQMARVIGYSAVPILLAPLLGPLLAGAILKYAGWPWLFYINLPVGVLAVVLAIYLVPHDEAMIRKLPFDFAGFVTLSPGLTCLLYGFERASHNKGVSFLILGVILASWVTSSRHGSRVDRHSLDGGSIRLRSKGESQPCDHGHQYCPETWRSHHDHGDRHRCGAFTGRTLWRRTSGVLHPVYCPHRMSTVCTWIGLSLTKADSPRS